MTLFSEVVAPLAIGAVLFASVLCAQAPNQSARPAPKLDPAVDALLTKLAGKRGPAAAGKDVSLAAEGSYVVTFEGVGEVAKGGLRELFSGTTAARCTSDVGQFGAMEKGLHDGVVWEVDPHFGAKVLRGTSAAAARRYFALLRGDDPRTTYREIVATGTQSLDGRDVTVLRMTPEEGSADTWYVDADGILLRVDTSLASPESADAAFGMNDLMAAQITFAEWQSVDGGRFPKQRVLTMGKAKVASTWSKITVGGAIEASKLTPPEAVGKVKNADVKPAMDGEGKPTYQIVENKAQPVASIRTQVKVTEISKQLAVLLPEVGSHLRAVGAKVAGAPFARYHSIVDGMVDLEAGIQVQQPFTESEKGRVKNSELPGGKAVTCWHIGPYDKLGITRDALLAHLVAAKQQASGGSWAVFWTDPGMVPDPAKWKTQLFAPIE